MQIFDHAIVPLDRAQIRAAADVAARAFAADPMFSYIFPDPARRHAPLRRFMLAGLRYGVLFGRVDTTADLAGSALWLTPDQPDIEPARMIRSGMATLPLTIGVGAFRRFLTFTSYGDRVHTALMCEPHWYLLNLAVDPLRQRQGIGSALIEPVLQRADRDRQACYLETNNPANLPFYVRHGFEIGHAGQVPNGGPAFWGLVRNPRIRSD